jgi:glycosyltransferase involved in cell wall biosynthesis
MLNESRSTAVLMLLTNAYDPDPRVRQEALALIRMGCSVKLLAWDRDLKSPAFQCMEGVDVERVFLRSKHGRGSLQVLFYPLLYLKMLWRGWKCRFDVIHCHDLDTLPLGFVLGKMKRKPIVYDAHESFPDMLEGNVHPTVLNNLRRLERFFIRRIDLLITVGEKLRRHFVTGGARKTAVVGNWKRLEEYERTAQENSAVREFLGIPQSAVVVVSISQLFADRKLEELLDAIDITPDIYLVIGGKGRLEDMVKGRVATNPRMRYIGFVSAEDIPVYTCAADIVYYGCDPENPNVRKFSAPNKLFEALAAGKPIVTGNFGEIADVVRAHSCGIILEHYSKESISSALETLRDAATRKRFSDNALSCGRAGMNWKNGEAVLRQEYSLLSKNVHMRPAERPTSSGVIAHDDPVRIEAQVQRSGRG